jgi:hypothetical protein
MATLSIEDRLSSLERTMSTIQEILNKIIKKSSLEEEEKTHFTQPLETPKRKNPSHTLQKNNTRTSNQTQYTPQAKPHTQSNTTMPAQTKNDITSSNHNPNTKDNLTKLETAKRMNTLENNVNKILQMLNNIQKDPTTANTNTNTTPMETQNITSSS